MAKRHHSKCGLPRGRFAGCSRPLKTESGIELSMGRMPAMLCYIKHRQNRYVSQFFHFVKTHGLGMHIESDVHGAILVWGNPEALDTLQDHACIARDVNGEPRVERILNVRAPMGGIGQAPKLDRIVYSEKEYARRNHPDFKRNDV